MNAAHFEDCCKYRKTFLTYSFLQLVNWL